MVWNPNITVAAIIEEKGRFLLVEEKVDGELVLNQPAGHLERGESLTQAVIRETREEAACIFVPESLIGIYHWQHPAKPITYIRFAFSGTVQEYLADQPLDQGITRTVWMNISEIRANRIHHRSPMLLANIEDYLAGQIHNLDLIHTLFISENK
ncbi:MAG: NUDIX hydrolase [Proteobacteria bacterium]|nr:NUDIX hydrolase [Pseudomonadota bacterium]